MTPLSRPKLALSLSLSLGLCLAVGTSCSSEPAAPKIKRFAFPLNAYVGDVQRPYTPLGPVRAKVEYMSLDSNHEEKDLCRNYYNRAVRDLVKFAKKQGADAVVDVKSVVFLFDGRTEMYSTPECSDDGGEGQVLAQGIAVKWKGAPVDVGSWTEAAPPREDSKRSPSSREAAPAAPAKPASAPAVQDMSGAQYFPESLTPAAGETGTPAAVATSTQSPPIADDVDEPITARMHSYDPSQSLISTPKRGPSMHVLSAPQAPAPAIEAPKPSVLNQPNTNPTRVETEAAQVQQAKTRYNPADPRSIPGTLRKSLP